MTTYNLQIEDLFDEVDLLNKYTKLIVYINDHASTLKPLAYQKLKAEKKQMSDLVYRLAMSELIQLQYNSGTSSQLASLQLASKTIKDAIKLEQDVVKYSGVIIDIFLQVLKIASGGFTVSTALNVLNDVITQNGWGSSNTSTP